MNSSGKKRLVTYFASARMLLLLAVIWLVYYVTLAIWSKEAFGTFVSALRSEVWIQAWALLFLISLSLYLARSGMALFNRYRWKTVLWAVLPLGLFLFLAGFFVNAIFVNEGTLIVGSGDVVSPPWEHVNNVVGTMDFGLKDESLYGGDTELGIFQYEPKLVLRTQDADISIGIYPPTKIGKTYYHILDFGFAPGIRLTKDGKTLLQTHMVQRLLPPGSNDSFLLGNYPYVVDLRLSPSRMIEKGDQTARVYNLKSPTYAVRVKKGEHIVYEGLSNAVSFDGYELEVLPYMNWARIEAARRPGMALFVSGLLFIGLGLPLFGVFLVLRLMEKEESQD